MNKIVFTEEFCQPENLFPFTLTRQVQDIRIGVMTIREKWEALLDMPSFDKFENDYKDLDRAIILEDEIGDDLVYLIHGNILPTAELAQQVKNLNPGECILVPDGESIVYCISNKELQSDNKIKVRNGVELNCSFKEVKFPWHIFQFSAWGIQQDFDFLKTVRKKSAISTTNTVIAEESVFIEEGAVVEHCLINASEGPVLYLLKML